jgi:fused signal recognition particle receptor
LTGKACSNNILDGVFLKQEMELSSLVAIAVVVGFVALAIAATAKLGRKKRAREEVFEEEAPKPQPKKVETKRNEPEIPKPSASPKKAQAKVEPVPETPPKEEAKALVIPFPVIPPLKVGLKRTRTEGFVAKLRSLFTGKTLDERLLQDVEEVLISSDMGVKTASLFLDALKTEFVPSGRRALSDEVMDFLKVKAKEIFAGQEQGEIGIPLNQKPTVIMVVGVNGCGKTTTIGKLAHYYKMRGMKVLLGAGDTFRAAGSEQLHVWAERVGTDIVHGSDKADPASVIFDACKKAKDENYDMLIADTAGRLHTNVSLVDELKKVHRVMGKVIPEAPHQVLLVLDATMGQNAIRQAQIFREAVNVTGIVLAKLDGTAKGGVCLSIVKDMGLAIRFVGIGEKVGDLRPFDAEEYVSALFE